MSKGALSSCASSAYFGDTLCRGDAKLEKEFVAESVKAGLLELKGHRSVGGLRASIYNAMPIEGVDALCLVHAEAHSKLILLLSLSLSLWETKE